MIVAGRKQSRVMGRVVGTAAVALILAGLPARAADLFMKPTPEELSMTSLPGYPGVAAVILYREEVTRDALHVVQHYERIKVLTEKGKDYANVELAFVSSSGDGDFSGDDKEITDIVGRTIHPDGTVIPFTGKPYLKMIEKSQTAKYQARVFTLPDVEVGSIIEYRYATRINDDVVEAPDWYVQGELYTKAAHFAWYPTTHEISGSNGAINSITWFPILPQDAKLDQRTSPPVGGSGPQQVFELSVHDIAPQPEEEFMPPIKNFTYRVLFGYSSYRSGDDFWKSENKKWAKRTDSFIGSDKELAPITNGLIAGAQTQDEKLHKIYTAVMALENTDYTRDHGRKEDQAQGLSKVSNAADVYKRGRGTGDQLTLLFVGMARAAGMKGYAMIVPDRSRSLLTQGWTNFYQFDNTIAIVNVDGKERFFDPGARYCEYGHLSWQNTLAAGVRQIEGGADFATAPGEYYTATKSARVANLNMDTDGNITGTVNLTYTGAAALHWRHVALNGDEEALKTELRENLEGKVPKTLEVKLLDVANVTDYEKPLTARFEVKGSFGAVTGKRIIMPTDFFVASDVSALPHEKREMPVYFDYPEIVQDAIRINFPASMSVEALPADANVQFQTAAQYQRTATNTPTSFTVRRNYTGNAIVVPLKDYPDLRSFYSQMEAKDKDSIVLKVGTQTASAAGGN